MAEQKILKLLSDSNKPFNVQGVADMLATQGIKKGQAEKALAALAEAGKVTCKEFGKTKIYCPLQEGLSELSAEDKAAKMQQLKELQEQVKAEDEAVGALKKELSESNSTLSVEEIKAEIEKLTKESASLAEKLEALRGGAVLISAADVAAVESKLGLCLEGWARHKRIFMSIWNQVSENLEGKQADLFEEIGIDSDEAAGMQLSTMQQLLPKKARR